MSGRRSFGQQGPKIKPAAIGSGLFPQGPSNTPVTSDCFNSVFTKGREGDHQPQVYALWISMSRLKNNARSLAQVDKDILIGRDVGQLQRLMLANFYRRKCIANLSDGRPCSAMVFKRMVSRRDKRVTLGYFCIVYEAPNPGRRGGDIDDGKANDQKERVASKRRTCEFGEWLTHFINSPHPDNAFTELARDYKPNGGDAKLPEDDVESWGESFWKLRDMSEYARAVSDYTTLEFTAGNIKSNVFLNDLNHVLCPRNVFSAGTAVDAYKRDVERDSSASGAAEEMDGADENAVDDVPNFSWIQNHIENVALIRAKGLMPPDQSWALLHSQAHPSILDAFQLPHITAVVDTSSASFISFYASRSSTMTMQEAVQQYQRLHAPTVQKYGDMEAFRIEMIQRVTRVTDPIERMAVRMTGLGQFNSVWSTDCDYTGGSLAAVIAYGIEKNNKKQSMCSLMTVTDRNTDVLGQKFQRMMQGFETLFGINSMHYALIICLLAQLTASNDNDEENIITLLTGPAGASKSFIQKCAMLMAILGACDPIMHSTAMSDTTESSAQAHIRVYDESSAAQFGVQEGKNTLWDLVQRVLGNNSSGAGGEGLKVFKSAATSRTMTTRSIDLSTGRRLQVKVHTVIYGTRSYAINIELPELPDPVINRAVVINFTEANRDDGKDIFNSRANVSNATIRGMARHRFVEEYRNDMFLITRQNQLTACGQIVAPVNLKICGQLADVVTQNLIDGHFGKAMRRSREIGKINKLVTAAVQQRATALVFELGIGGPDPSRTFRDEDSLLTMPFNVATISTVVFQIELLRLFVNSDETEVVMNVRQQFFKDYFDKEAAYQKANPGFVRKPRENHPIEKMGKEAPMYRGNPIIERNGFLIITNVFSDDDFVSFEKVAEAKKKDGKNQSKDQTEAEVAAMGLANCLKRILQSFHSSMKSAPTENSAIAVLANLLNPRIQPMVQGDRIQAPMRIMTKSGVLLFHKETLISAHHDVVWNLLQGILADSDTGGQTFIRGRTEGDYFTFLRGKLGRDGSKVPSAAASARSSSPQVGASEVKSSQQANDDFSAMEDADSASGEVVKASSIPKKRDPHIVPGSRSGKLITKIINPEYCNPSQIDRMVKSGLITVAESKTFSGQSHIQTEKISDEQAVREHLTELRKSYGGAFWKIGDDLSTHYAMPANTREIMDVIYLWHDVCNQFKMAVYHVKTDGPLCSAEYKRQYSELGMQLLTHFNAYFEVLDKFSGLRETISPGWIEKWLVHFEIRLTHVIKRKSYRGMVEREHVVDSIRDALYQFCHTNMQITRTKATLVRETEKLEKYKSGAAKIDNAAAYAADVKRVEHIKREIEDSIADLEKTRVEYQKGLNDFKRFHCESQSAKLPPSMLSPPRESAAGISSAPAAAALRQAIQSEDALPPGGPSPASAHMDSKHVAGPKAATAGPVPMSDSPIREDAMMQDRAVEAYDEEQLQQQDMEALNELEDMESTPPPPKPYERPMTMAERVAADSARAAAEAAKAAKELTTEAARMRTDSERAAEDKARYNPPPPVPTDVKAATIDSVPLAFGGTEIKEAAAAAKRIFGEVLAASSGMAELVAGTLETKEAAPRPPAKEKRKRRKRKHKRKRSEFVDDAASGSEKESDETDDSEGEEDKAFVHGSDDEEEAPRHKAHKHARREKHEPTEAELVEMMEIQAEKNRFDAIKKSGRKARRKQAAAAAAAEEDVEEASADTDSAPKRKLKRLVRIALSDDEDAEEEEKKRKAHDEAIEAAQIAAREEAAYKCMSAVAEEERALGIDAEQNRDIEAERAETIDEF